MFPLLGYHTHYTYFIEMDNNSYHYHLCLSYLKLTKMYFYQFFTLIFNVVINCLFYHFQPKDHNGSNYRYWSLFCYYRIHNNKLLTRKQYDLFDNVFIPPICEVAVWKYLVIENNLRYTGTRAHVFLRWLRDKRNKILGALCHSSYSY